MTYVLGVDIGASFTHVALWRDGRAAVIALAEDATAVPSAVFLRPDGSLLIGQAAIDRGVLEPERLAKGFHRSLADRTPLYLGGESLTRSELTGHLLRWVIEAVTVQQGSSPAYVTLTCPAAWGDHHRDLMSAVATDAGLRDVSLLAEPVAVALRYATEVPPEPGTEVAVFDLGGGSFDAAVVRRSSHGYELIGRPGGDEGVAGDDFDDVVMAHVRRSLGNALTLLDPTDDAVLAAMHQVRRGAVAAKEQLSTDIDTSIAVSLPGITRTVRLTRGEFESAIRVPVLRSVDALTRCIAAAGMDPTGLRAILLAGGSSRIPLISQMLADELGVPVVTDDDPADAACLGAALAAASRWEKAVDHPGPLDQRPHQNGSPTTAKTAPDSGAGDPAPATEPRPTGGPRTAAGPRPGVEAAFLLAGDQQAPERFVEAGPGDIRLDAPPDLPLTTGTAVRSRLRYLSDRDELVVEHHTDRRRGARLLIVAIAAVLAIVAAASAIAAQGWWQPDQAAPAANSAVIGSATAGPSTQSSPGAVPVTSATVTALTVATEPGDVINGIAPVTDGVIAVGESTESGGAKVWSGTGDTWTALPVPPVRDDQTSGLEGVVGGDHQAIVAVGWTAPRGDGSEPAKRQGAVWVSTDGRAWVSATVPEVGELTDVTRLDSGALIATGVSYTADPLDGDAIVLDSPDGARWQIRPTHGLDGPGPFELRSVLDDKAGGLVAVGSRLEGGVSRSGLWASTNGVDWSLAGVLSGTGPGAADAWGLARARDGTLVAVGNESGLAASAIPTVWWQTAGEMRPHPADAGAALFRDIATTAGGYVIVGAMDSAAGSAAAAWRLTAQS